MKTVKLFIVALFVSVLIYSCTQEGPVGPTGPTGTTGPVASTDVIGPSILSTWALDTVNKKTNDTNIYYAVLADPNILHYTTDQVVAYVEDTAGGGLGDFYVLPSSNNLPLPNATLSYSYNTDTVRFYYQSTVGKTLPPTFPITVKVVVIPDGIMKQHPGLNLADYKTVMALVQNKAIK
ncbi:MAG TPA: hypothetical protein VK783_07435 [Bacteroidia bacterium]|jgi:hypothetical protein|nr:hypothetical protein [Bacteroidia bacterium]